AVFVLSWVLASGLGRVPLLGMVVTPSPTASTFASMACVAMFVPAGPAMRLPVIVSGAPDAPRVPAGDDDDVPLPTVTWMPPPEGKLVMVLSEMVGFMTAPAAPAVPRTSMRMAVPSELAPDVLLVSVLLLIVSELIVPPNCWMSTPW